MAAKQRLRDKMREDLALRGMSRATIDSYVRCARRFAEYHGRSPSAMGRQNSARSRAPGARRKVAPALFNVYVGALKFLYGVTLDRAEALARMPRMRVPMHIPVVLTTVEVSQLLTALKTDKHRAMVMLAYGAGLRVSEVCKLRVDDIDPKRMLIHVRETKRGRERYVMLSPKLLATLRAIGRRRAPPVPSCFRDAMRMPS